MTDQDHVPAVPTGVVVVGIDGPRAGPQHDQLKRCQAAMEKNGDGEEESATAKLFHPDELSCCCGAMSVAPEMLEMGKKLILAQR